MIQTYSTLKKQLNLINNIFDGQVFIQKIYSTAFYICFSLRGAGKTRYLYIGRGAGQEGIWIADDKPEAELRKRDTFLEYLRKHLSSTSFEELELDNKDRIIRLVYGKWGNRNCFDFFYLGRKLYFSNYFFDPDKRKLFLYKSWEKKSQPCEHLNFDHFNEVGRKEIDTQTENKTNSTIMQLLDVERSLGKKDKFQNKKKKFWDRKVLRIENDLGKVVRWRELFEIANSEEDFSTYPAKTQIVGIKFSFEYKDHFKRRNQIFEKVKSLKKAEDILEARLKQALESKNNNISENEENNLIPIKPYWNTKSVVKNASNSLNSSEYKIYQNNELKIAIGLSAKGNDELRKNWANKDDFWFHLDGDKSPHVFVKLKDSQLTQDVITIIGSAMLEFSKLQYSQADLIYTQVKNLKGVPGVAGKVNFKKVKRVRVEKNNNWTHYFTIK